MTGEDRIAGATVVLAVVTVVFAIISINNQNSANDNAVRIEKTAEAETAANIVTVGNETAEVYLTHVQEAKAGLIAAIEKQVELQEYVLPTELDPSVGDGVAMLSTKASPNILRDLGALRGQMHITYDNFLPPAQHAPLRPKDLLRICRTIVFANQVEFDLKDVPNVRLSAAEPHVPGQCKSVLTNGVLAALHVSPAAY